MERFQRFKYDINIPAFDPGNYYYVSLISSPSKRQNELEKHIVAVKFDCFYQEISE